MRIITITGFMGSGKSTVGRALAAGLGADFADLDDCIVESVGRSIPEIFAEGGESSFREIECRVLASLLDSAEGKVGGTIVIALGGGTMTCEASRRLILDRTESIFLRTGLDTIRRRLGTSDSSRPLFKDAERLYRDRAPIYALANHIVDTDNLTPQEIVGNLIALLR